MRIPKHWDSEEIFFDAKSFFNHLSRDIQKATATIEVETYIFADDDVGRSITDLLNKAALRGVQIRIMVDGIGSSFSSIRFLLSHLSPGVQARVYHPLPWVLPWAFLIGPLHQIPSFRLLVRMFFSLNRRNHRKTWIFDNKTAYVGSMNICDRPWRETAVRVEGGGVSDLLQAFERTWRGAGAFVSAGSTPRLPRKIRRRRRDRLGVGKNFLVRLNDTWKTRRRINRDLLARIESARDQIWITNAYFIPHTSLLRRLCKAARRGVDVRILVPQNCDIIFIPWVRATFYFALLNSGVRIFEYLPSMLHAKSMVIDEWALVGSSNLNHRSLHHDLEADVVLTDDNVKRRLIEQFRRDQVKTHELSVSETQQRSIFQIKTAEALLLLKNWM